MASDEVPYTAQPDQIVTQKWSKYMVELYRAHKAPLLGLLTPDAIEEKAKQSYKDTDRMRTCCIFLCISEVLIHPLQPLSTT